MNSLQIQYFLHLCQTLSVSETARQLYVAQPAVSKQIAALEKELDVVLFDRTNRGVSLTPSGELICRLQEKLHTAAPEMGQSGCVADIGD